MIRYSAVLALALVLAPVTCPSPAHALEVAGDTVEAVGDTAEAAGDTAEVLAAAEAFLIAFERLDWEPFHAAFAPSATAFMPFGRASRYDDREEIAGFFRSFFQRVRAAREGLPYLQIEPEDLRVHRWGDAAVVTFHLPGEEDLGRRTLVFRRDGPEARWRIVHLHASSLERGEGAERTGEEN